MRTPIIGPVATLETTPVIGVNLIPLTGNLVDNVMLHRILANARKVQLDIEELKGSAEAGANLKVMAEINFICRLEGAFLTFFPYNNQRLPHLERWSLKVTRYSQALSGHGNGKYQPCHWLGDYDKDLADMLEMPLTTFQGCPCYKGYSNLFPVGWEKPIQCPTHFPTVWWDMTGTGADNPDHRLSLMVRWNDDEMVTYARLSLPLENTSVEAKPAGRATVEVTFSVSLNKPGALGRLSVFSHTRSVASVLNRTVDHSWTMSTIPTALDIVERISRVLPKRPAQIFANVFGISEHQDILLL